MALGDGIRRNVAKVSPEERNRLRDAFIQLDTSKFYPDGVSFWDKQEDIHKEAHGAGQDVHGGPAFLPWHRELTNRLEALLREVDPGLSLHYWDWTTDPRSSPDEIGVLALALALIPIPILALVLVRSAPSLLEQRAYGPPQFGHVRHGGAAGACELFNNLGKAYLTSFPPYSVGKTRTSRPRRARYHP